ncbi:sporulation initiation factor Spo0A C-terminal domain-containing protein [Lachnospiraceae bacterium 42-17]|jgi:CheY-like chemotaxis protein|nr:response regulator [Dorea sp.]
MSLMNVRVMVVEDEAEVREKYRKLISGHPMLHFVAETGNANEALHILQTETIDAVILDLEMPQGSGIIFLSELQMLEIEKPFIAVVTNVVSKTIYDAVRQMGADYICAKGSAGFSWDTPLSIIELTAPYRRTKEAAADISHNVNHRTRMNIYQRSISLELSRMGFPSKRVGTVYCEEAILAVAMSDKRDIMITKEIYPRIALNYQTNAKNVERVIRLVIEKVWTEQDIRILQEVYPYEWNSRAGRPTNAEFIHNMAQKIIRH